MQGACRPEAINRGKVRFRKPPSPTSSEGRIALRRTRRLAFEAFRGLCSITGQNSGRPTRKLANDQGDVLVRFSVAPENRSMSGRARMALR